MTIHYLPGRGSDSNVYLVSGKDPILVDTGTGRHVHEILSKLEALGARSSVRRIVLTHNHYDHVGGAAALKSLLSAEVLIHEADAGPLRRGDGEVILTGMFGSALEAVEVTDLKGGEVLSTGEHDLKVLHTPGHTPGSICLHDAQRKALITGDTVFVGGVGRWDLPAGDFDALVRSIKTINGLILESIYPGHGPCGIKDGKAQIKEALNYLEVS